MAVQEKVSGGDLALGAIFSYLSLKELGRCSCVCKQWERVIRNGGPRLWKPLVLELVPKRAQKSKTMKDCFQYLRIESSQAFRAMLRSFLNSWSPHDHSPNMRVTEDPYVMHREPVAQSSDLARTKYGFKDGQHSWMVRWPSSAGSEAVLGVALESARKQCSGYVGLLGENKKGWGWHLGKGKLLHDGGLLGQYPLPGTKEAPFSPSEVDWITVNLDMDKGCLWFERNDKFLGMAFDNLPTSDPLYPAFSAVFGNTRVSLVYVGSPVLG
ncbi:F-box/SPRY domain-containing protein 1-like [Sycon ciliatum]|uniref:F-box/SPRY domain-containing protein 1-like n=1 Tax=Sycon ciliatum TaxID=27933 RepID=UPI0020AEC796|eukprot:scpid93102/ scgid23729/ F-box/SPRY domain-containing protein 1